MNAASDIGRWNEIAWNGVTFRKPSCWEIVTLDRNYLMLGTRAGPRMDVSWGSPSETAQPLRRTKQLQARIGGKQGLPLDPWNPPQCWLDALPDHKFSGFIRKDSAEKALILSCNSCNRVSLWQFYQHNSEDSEHFDAAVTDILSSFRDHAAHSCQLWAVFDIRAALPTALQIKSYQFSPGFMTMDFISPGLKISLYRWSPASVLLAGRTLSEFAVALPFFPGSEFEIRQEDASRMEWIRPPSFQLTARIASLFSYGHHRFFIRHDREANRILAARAESKKPIDSCFFTQMVADYEITTAQPD